MGLSRGGIGGGSFKEYAADMTNNILFIDGVEYQPYEVTTIVGTKHAYYHVPESVHEDIQKPYRFSSFIFYAFGDTTYITIDFFKPDSMCISNGGIVIEDTSNKYCVVIDKE